MLITFLGWSLKESYQARMKDQARVDAERVRESQESAERSRQEAKEFADRLEQIYRSNKDDTQRMYQEQRDLVSSLRASQDAHLEKLLGLAFAGGTAK